MLRAMELDHWAMSRTHLLCVDTAVTFMHSSHFSLPYLRMWMGKGRWWARELRESECLKTWAHFLSLPAEIWTWPLGFLSSGMPSNMRIFLMKGKACIYLSVFSLEKKITGITHGDIFYECSTSTIRELSHIHNHTKKYIKWLNKYRKVYVSRIC